MHQLSRGRRGRFSGWPLAGLLLVLAFLGHDLLMAGPAWAATAPTPASPHQAHSQPASHFDASDIDPLAPAPHHLQDCGVGQWAVPRASDEPEIIQTELTPRGVSQMVSALHRSATPLWHEPGRSAPHRRALLQVYRI